MENKEIDKNEAYKKANIALGRKKDPPVEGYIDVEVGKDKTNVRVKFNTQGINPFKWLIDGVIDKD